MLTTNVETMELRYGRHSRNSLRQKCCEFCVLASDMKKPARPTAPRALFHSNRRDTESVEMDLSVEWLRRDLICSPLIDLPDRPDARHVPDETAEVVIRRLL